MKNIFLFFLFLTLFGGSFSQSFPNPVTLSTGQGVQGTLDPVWEVSEWFNVLPTNTLTLTYSPALISNNCAPGSWLNPSTLPAPVNNGNWISSSGMPCDGISQAYVSFRLTLNLPADCAGNSLSVAGNYVLNMDGYVDNILVDVFINGVSENVPGLPSGGFTLGTQTSVSLDGPWVPGLNYIDFIVNNNTGGGGNLASTGDGDPYGFLMVANTTNTANTDSDGDLINDLIDECPCEAGTNLVGCTTPPHPNNCDLDQIRLAMAQAGCTELASCESNCSLYFYNPQSLSGSAAQTFAQTFGANLISVQSAAENACISTALTANGFGGTIWIGFTDENSEGNYYWYDGQPVVFTNWNGAEPNNSGGNEDCTQIFPNGLWNDLNCNGGGAKSVIEVNLCPQITASNDTTICKGTAANLVCSNAEFGSPPYIYTWSGGQIGQSVTVSPTVTTIYTVTVTGRYGCSFSESIEVSVVGNVVANFTSSDFCIDEVVQFTDNSIVITPDALSNSVWDFGDASQLSGNQVTHGYSSVGSYLVTHDVATTNGCIGTVTKTIIIKETPHAEFSLIDGCFQNVAYTDASTITSPEIITTWSWDIDNDGTEDYNTQNPSHLFTAGNYTSKLTVTSALGCEKDTVMPVVIYPKPVANFTFTNKCLYDSLPFLDASVVSGTDIIAEAIWNFGENPLPMVDAQITNPYYTYSTAGVYTVTEIVTTNNGCLDTITKQVEAYTVPVSVFSVGNACLDVATSYNENSTIANGSITNWNWSFGDLNYGTNQNETHTYASDGSYDVQLVVTSDNLCKDTLVQSLIVFASPQVAFSMQNNCLEEETGFTDNTIINSPGVLGNWIWDFGDASALDPAQSPTHTYQTAGTYDVKLIVVSTDNCPDTLTQSVTVYPLPLVGFTATEICVNTPPTVFTNTSAIASGANVGFAWSFGDVGSSTSTQENPIFDYGIHGTFDVTLVIVSDNVCSDTLTQTVKVKHKPEAKFVQDTTGGCAPICVDFVGQSTDSIGIATWSWKFEDTQGEGNHKYEAYCYDEEGIFEVELIVMNTEGCFDVVTKPGLIKTFGYPTAEFELSPSETTILDSDIEFVNSSSDTLVWMWSFDDGMYDSLNYEPVHHYGDTGVYMVGLTIYNVNGCSDVVYHQVIITPVENIFVPTAFSPNGDGENDVLYVRGYIDGLYFSVYDRWGKKVFESKDQTRGWNGTINGKQAVEGVYMWYLQTTINGEPKKLKGDVSLMR